MDADRWDKLQEEIRNAFTDSWYSLSDIKEKLQDIFDRNGIRQTASATDLQKYYQCRPAKRSTESGGRVNGFELNGPI